MTDDRLPLAELLAKAGDGDFLRSVAEAVVQLLMETDVEGVIGAGRHERSGERTTYRNGYRDRTLDTRLGSLQLRIPKLRKGRSYEEGRQRAALCQTVAVRSSMETGMSIASQRSETPSAVRVDLGAIFISLELDSVEVADHLVVAGRRREAVAIQHIERQRCRNAWAFCRTPTQSRSAHYTALFNHRHPRGGARWLLDSSRA